jgi:hypothetical protein
MELRMEIYTTGLGHGMALFVDMVLLRGVRGIA